MDINLAKKQKTRLDKELKLVDTQVATLPNSAQLARMENQRLGDAIVEASVSLDGSEARIKVEDLTIDEISKSFQLIDKNSVDDFIKKLNFERDVLTKNFAVQLCLTVHLLEKVIRRLQREWNEPPVDILETWKLEKRITEAFYKVLGGSNPQGQGERVAQVMDILRQEEDSSVCDDGDGSLEKTIDQVINIEVLRIMWSRRMRGDDLDHSGEGGSGQG